MQLLIYVAYSSEKLLQNLQLWIWYDMWIEKISYFEEKFGLQTLSRHLSLYIVMRQSSKMATFNLILGEINLPVGQLPNSS